jgi:hypothetical protein
MKASNEKYQNSEYRQTGWLQNFFILCSGADRKIINEFPTEWNKFAGIGATIFLTACLALLSGAYAMHFAFENGLASVLFGIFWAIVIFNLDRYIVLSLRKEKIPTTTDIKRESNIDKKEELNSERKRLLWNQALMASPRFAIALLIAVTVSKPIELRLFENRIDKELENIVNRDITKFDANQQNKITNLNNQLTAINKQEAADKDAIFSKDPIYQDAKNNILQIQSDIQRKDSTFQKNKEIISRNYVTVQVLRYNELNQRIPPYSKNVPNATAVQKIYENRILVTEIRNLKNNLTAEQLRKNSIESTLINASNSVSTKYEPAKTSITQQINNVQQTYLLSKPQYMNASKRSADLPARLEALGNISLFSFNPQNVNFLGNSIWWASFVITLLFIALETAPVIVKLLTKRGPYDERLDAIEYQVYIEESRKVDSLNREINEYMKLANEAAKLSGSLKLNAEKDKLDIELRNNRELLNKLADYQKELADIYAEAWFQEEKAKALQQAKGLYQQASQINQQPKFENTFWKQKGAVDKIEYFFRNGSLIDNELLYFKNDQLNKGKWSFNSTKDEVVIDLLNNKVEYEIIEIKDIALKLRDKATNDVIEFVKV